MEKAEIALEPVETANKAIETAEEEKTDSMSEDSEIELVVNETESKYFDSTIIELALMNKKQSKNQKSYLT